MKNTAIDTKNDKEPIVELNDVWVAYDGKWILKSIYFNCYPGEIFGIPIVYHGSAPPCGAMSMQHAFGMRRCPGRVN